MDQNTSRPSNNLHPEPNEVVDTEPDACDSVDAQQRGQWGCKPAPPPSSCPEGKDNCAEKNEVDLEELLAISCPCGFGYYTFDREWVSGADVRAGRALPRPGMVLPQPAAGSGPLI
ncbi:hypothetical protein QBC34DRAFT_413333 [Podospora aff. communis PSN243]|uniref:Uncharacterized protein n=1 Tax=Podospora aff. communis PSN243 TaxID=3040156 RepID=A0AAV9GDW7_9PEZI|nr:hypothetical protein QBC34DRAFT_413333 [Podospora aff. communis PSN243]